MSSALAKDVSIPLKVVIQINTSWWLVGGKVNELIQEKGRNRYSTGVLAAGAKGFAVPKLSKTRKSRQDIAHPVKRAARGGKGLEVGDERSRNHTLLGIEVSVKDGQGRGVLFAITRFDIDVQNHVVPKN